MTNRIYTVVFFFPLIGSGVIGLHNKRKPSIYNCLVEKYLPLFLGNGRKVGRDALFL